MRAARDSRRDRRTRSPAAATAAGSRSCVRVCAPRALRGDLRRSIAEDSYVAAEREHADLVLGLAERDADERPAVAEREAQHLDVQELGRDEVAELVDDHQHADEQEEVKDRQT